jgi:hypothetical protein
MTFDEKSRVDVNTATASYTVDQTVQNMEQEPITKTTVEYIIVREGDSDPTPSVLTADHKIRYTFPLTGMVSLVRKTTTTTEEVLFFKQCNDEVAELLEDSARRRTEQAQRRAKTEAELQRIEQERLERRPRKPRKKETEPRATCHASCCGAPNRHQSHLDGFCFDCRPSKSASRQEVKY